MMVPVKSSAIEAIGYNRATAMEYAKVKITDDAHIGAAMEGK